MSRGTRFGYGAVLAVLVLVAMTAAASAQNPSPDGAAAPRVSDAGGAAAEAEFAIAGNTLSAEGSTEEQSSDAADSNAKPRGEIYGFAMLDMGYDFKQVDPDWFDVLRVTKLPAFADQFGEDGNFYAGVRQSRLGVKGWFPTSAGEIKTIFEFELFGTGADAGQTTFRLRHAWGELGQFGAGQYWSAFMDIDVFPNTIEYWGPPGMALFRNVQARWTPIQGDTELAIALERPGASADQGRFADRIELQDVKGRFPLPDLSAHFKMKGDWGHVQVAGILRYMEWVDTVDDAIDLSGDDTGWGLNLSTNIKMGKTGVIRASVLYGEGIQNYMNDAPVDVGTAPNASPTQPIIGEALPILGIVAYYDFYWNENLSSAIGYSMIDIDNSVGQEPDAFATGEYASANVLYYPVKGVMTGFEFIYGRRENKSDGFEVDDYRLQFSAKYNFSFGLGGK